MICSLCNKECNQFKIVQLFGATRCLHDDKIKLMRVMSGVSIKNDSLSVKIARSGKDRTEQKYIETAQRRGDAVVRGSDGLLRAIEKE